MKRTRLLLSAFLTTLLLSAAVHAQIASSECLPEVKAVYQRIAPQTLLKSDKVTMIKYHHTYTTKTDPNKEKRMGEEWRMYSRDFVLHDSPDVMECSDAGETFHYRRHQFVIYRTKSALSKAAIIPGSDEGLFDHCLVRECRFVPHPDIDSTNYKRAFLTVNAEGQKKYKIKDMEVIWNPADSAIVRAVVNFTEASMTTWAAYKFHSIEPDYQADPKPTDAKAEFLEASGELKNKFTGVELKDYR